MSRSDLHTNPALNVFFQHDFDPNSFISQIIKEDDQNGGADNALRSLSSKLRLVDELITNQLQSNQCHLLNQTQSITKLHKSLSSLLGSVDSLQSASNHLRDEIIQPINNIRKIVTQLDRVLSTTDNLQRIMRFSFAVRKLKQMDVFKDVDYHEGEQNHGVDLPEKRRFHLHDLSKAAQLLSEVKVTLGEGFTEQEEPILKKISVLAKHLPWLSKCEESITESTWFLLIEAVDSEQQANIGTCLTIFLHLDQLGRRINQLFRELLEQFQSSLQKTLSLTELASSEREVATGRPGVVRARIANPRLKDGQQRDAVSTRSTEPAPNEANQWRTILWTKIDDSCTYFYLCIARTCHVDKILQSRRDPARRLTFQTLAELDESFLQKCWFKACETFKNQITKFASESKFVNNSLVNESPRLRAALFRLLQRLVQNGLVESEILSGTELDHANKSKILYDSLFQSVDTFVETFLARSLSRLNEPVSMMFPMDTNALLTLPTGSDIKTFVDLFQRELYNVREDPELVVIVLRGIAKAIQLFAVRVESISYTEAEKLQFSMDLLPTFEQSHNLEILKLCLRLESSISALVLPQTSRAFTSSQKCLGILYTAVQSIDAVLYSIMTGIFNSALSLLHKALRPGFSAPPGHTSETSNSRVLQNLRGTLHALQHMHFDNFPQNHVISLILQNRFAAQIVSLFVSYCSLTRPFSTSTCHRLANELAAFELDIDTILGPKSIGPAYVELRAFRELIFMSEADFLDPNFESVFAKRLRPSTILHHLFSRITGPTPTISSVAECLDGIQYLESMNMATGIAFGNDPLMKIKTQETELDINKMIEQDSECWKCVLGWEHAEAKVQKVISSAMEVYRQRCATENKQIVHPNSRLCLLIDHLNEFLLKQY